MDSDETREPFESAVSKGLSLGIVVFDYQTYCITDFFVR